MLDAPEITVAEFLKEEDDVDRESEAALLRTWKRVPDSTSYRLARSTDFIIPEWVGKERYWSDVERAINHASVRGETSGAKGLAVIVVDKRLSPPQRFSCLVFVSRPGNRYDLYWIFKNEDLSHFTMGRHSGDVYLSEYREDGTTRVCDIQFSRKQKRWACEFY
jgi:hypothetical protein